VATKPTFKAPNRDDEMLAPVTHKGFELRPTHSFRGQESKGCRGSSMPQRNWSADRMNFDQREPTHAPGLNGPFDYLCSVLGRGDVGDGKGLQRPEGRARVRRLSI